MGTRIEGVDGRGWGSARTNSVARLKMKIITAALITVDFLPLILVDSSLRWFSTKGKGGSCEMPKTDVAAAFALMYSVNRPRLRKKS